MSYFPCLTVFLCLLSRGVSQWSGLKGAENVKFMRVVSPALSVSQSAYIWAKDSGVSFASRSKMLIGTGISRNRAYTDYNTTKIAIKLRKDIGKVCFLLDVAPAVIGTFNATRTALKALTLLNTTIEKSFLTVGNTLSVDNQAAFDLQQPFLKQKCTDREYSYVNTAELAAGAAPPPASDKFTVFTTWGKVNLYILRATGLVTTTTTTTTTTPPPL